jgi:hypothetical protein
MRKMKLNKTIKTHIADMAIRSKFKEQYIKELTELVLAVEGKLKEENHNSDFASLPDRALKLVRSTTFVDIDIRMNKVERHGRVSGYGLNIAFDTRNEIGRVKMREAVYCNASSYHGVNIPQSCDLEFGKFKSFLKMASDARQTLLDAMASYKSCKAMFAELPWSEEFYPAQEKKPECNIVPVSTIAAANELMGI